MYQLPLNFVFEPNHHEDDFVVSECNQAAWLALQAWDQCQQPAALLKGPGRSGKTHLASIWASRNQAMSIAAVQLPLVGSLDVFCQDYPILVVEDCEQLMQQELLFHLINLTRQQPEMRLLLTVDSQACWQGFSLPDLRSRLQALPQAMITDPDDVLLTTLLLKQLHDRQLQVQMDMISYVVPRLQRDFASIHQFVDALDRMALQQQKLPGQRMARIILQNLQGSG